jgi:SAM-dependent methyltransferase
MKKNNVNYIGTELDLFAFAKNWKGYYARLLLPYISGRVLEVGGGIGSTLKSLINSKVNHWVAVEPDASLAARYSESLKENTFFAKVDILVGTISETEPRPEYNCILYIDVLEHIKDDLNELKMAAERLLPGGHLVVLSPAHACLFTEFDRSIGHFRRYSAKELARCGKQDNIRNIRLFYLDSVGMLLSMANKLLLHQSMPSPLQIKTWDSCVIPVSKIIDRCLGYHVGKSVIGIWKKL